MTDYIERKAFLEHMKKTNRYFDVKFDIEEFPAADVAPVVHGRWDDIPNAYMSVVSKDGVYHGNATTCSICHEVNPNAYKTNYCPNCGAKCDL